MTHPREAAQGLTPFADATGRDADCFDVAVLVEHELTGTAARRIVDMYQMKSEPPRYHVVRPLGEGADRNTEVRAEAEQLVQKSLERLESLRARTSGTVSEQGAIDALSSIIDATHSQEVVVVTRRHRLDALLHRDWASQVRAHFELPIVHLVDR
ncbi:hypothetical protein [Kribbella sp. NBC_00889]|uniref:hypothetical protein n=1 Tax=Kribbella sp. NBC_00889 TaxID=2975974 RepID=UPI00386F2F7C|nr:hypothetical protein OG817_13025 [Kribbella sp. NBC_00889]